MPKPRKPDEVDRFCNDWLLDGGQSRAVHSLLARREKKAHDFGFEEGQKAKGESMKKQDFYMVFSLIEAELGNLRQDANATKSIKEKIDDAIELISEIQSEIDC